MNKTLNRYKNDIKDEIKSRVDIVQVIGRYVKLKPFGQNLKGLCPFHREKTPSFNVNPSNGVFYCFGCGKGGDIYTFLMDIEGLSFPEAVKRLGDEAGISVELFKNYRYSSKQGSVSKVRALEIHELATLYFYRQVKYNPEAVSYFKSRNLLPETVKEFKLGYAPDGWSKLINYMSSKRISAKTLALCGLVIKHSQKGSVYDRFRNRIIFPIFDISGRTIAFAGRSLDSDVEPKYLNSPETNIYQKSKTLYGLHLARKHIKEKGYVIIVEGYMDYLSLYQAGIRNVVATSGTSFTEDHGQILKRFTNTIVLFFDGDEAGLTAAEKTILMLTPYNFEIKIIALEHKEDPDSFIIKNGIDAFHSKINNSEGAIHFLLSRLKDRFEVSSITGKAEIIKRLKPFVCSLSDSITKSSAIREIAEQLDIKEQLLYTKFSAYKRDNGNVIKNTENHDVKRYLETEEGSFLHIIVKEPSYIKLAQKYVNEEFFTNTFSRKLFSLINNSYSHDQLLYNNIINNSGDSKINQILSLMLIKEITSQNQEEDLSHKARRFLLKIFKKKKHAITRKIKNEENVEKRVKLLDEQQKIITQYGELIKGW